MLVLEAPQNAHGSATFLDGKALSAELPNIHLEDIGREDEGASPAAIAEQIIAALTAGTTGAVSSLGLEEIMGGAGKLLEGVAEGTGELLESVTGAFAAAGEALEGVVEGAGEALEGAAEGAAKALGNLFGGSSD